MTDVSSRLSSALAERFTHEVATAAAEPVKQTTARFHS